MTKESEDIDREPQESGKSDDEAQSVKTRRAFSKLRYELSDDDLKSPGVQKMLLNEIDRLEREQIDLLVFRTNFHIVDKEKAILSEKFKTLIWSEVLYTIGIAIGPLLIGISFSLQKYSSFVFISGIALAGISIISRIIKKWI